MNWMSYLFAVAYLQAVVHILCPQEHKGQTENMKLGIRSGDSQKGNVLMRTLVWLCTAIHLVHVRMWFATSCPRCGKNFKSATCVLNHLNQPYSLYQTQYWKRLKCQQQNQAHTQATRAPTDTQAPTDAPAVESLSVSGPAKHSQGGYFPMDVSEGIDLVPSMHKPITNWNQIMNQFQQLTAHLSSLKNILVHQKYTAMGWCLWMALMETDMLFITKTSLTIHFNHARSGNLHCSFCIQTLVWRS